MADIKLVTSESVCAGHPDKICDQISDAILDAVLAQDQFGKTAIETVVAKGKVFIAGEINTSAKVDFEAIARSQIKRLGYTNPSWGFSDKSQITIDVHQQSPEIARGVNHKGAGDQGLMFGYAARETEQLMPLPVTVAHALARAIDTTRESGLLDYLRPDGKSQITIEYKNGVPYKATKVVLAVPHSEQIKLSHVKTDLYKHIVVPTLEAYGLKIAKADLVVNGTGVWHMPGPGVDTGLTGRKVVVDNYGGSSRVGGGAFSGKDPSKVDRSGAYAARFIAKNLVARGLAKRCEVSLAYFIGARTPLMQEIECFGTETEPKTTLFKTAANILDTSVTGIIDGLNLRQPIYLQTAAYGHFGRPEFPWEDLV